MPLTTKIFIGLALGLVAGLAGGTESIPFMKDWVAPFGTVFINLIKMIIVPLVLASLVVGVASLGDVRKLGRIGVKTVGYYLSTKIIAITIGLFLALTFTPGDGLSIPVDAKLSMKDPVPLSTVLVNMIPANPFDAFAKADMLQTIVFAIFVGIAIIMVGEKAKVLESFFDALAEVSYKIIGMVMKFAPYGVFALIAPVAAANGPKVLLPLAAIIGTVFLACLIHMLIVYCSVVAKFGKMSPIAFFKAVSPAMLVAFSTCSSSATLPVSMQCAQDNLGASKDVSSFVLPLGATVNMDGTAIYVGIATLFVAQVYGIDLTMGQLLTIVLTGTLASIGTAGVPGAGLIMLTLALQSVNLPLEGIALVAGIDRILDMMRTTLNITGDLVGVVFVDSTEQTNT
ncbi:MAG: dicarboxylate/amino acid:cation symporter [Sporomusaceae bacterium]|jgi:Na+/H+-dicarboxylate symporter|nr:dicarboxylate/amino acid:cation symporter [Sporomusaceae bacterium]